MNTSAPFSRLSDNQCDQCPMFPTTTTLFHHDGPCEPHGRSVPKYLTTVSIKGTQETGSEKRGGIVLTNLIMGFLGLCNYYEGKRLEL